MKRTDSIKMKMIAVSLLLLIIPLIILGVFSYTSSKESLNRLGKTALTNSVEQTLEMIDALNEEVEKDNLSLEDAQEKVKEAVLGAKDSEGNRPINKKIDIGEHGYIFILDDEGNQIAHPVLEGENSWDTTDPKGIKSTQENIKQANNGGGFTYFSWPLPNNDNKIAPKVAYAKKDNHWGWNVVAGTYLMDFNKPAKNILNIIIIVSVIAVIIGATIIWMFANKISNPLIEVAKRMDALSKGDLSMKDLNVKSRDEVGMLARSMNRMQSDLKKVITEIKSASEIINQQSSGLSHSAIEVKMGAEQISTTMQELAIASENEANSASDLSSIMNDLSEQIKGANSGGESISKASVNMIDISDKGSSLMNQSTEQMNKIHQIVQGAAAKMEELDKQAQNISELVAVIQEIAEQTNLLALNAAIEAARAGEHGQGFSVVADEVRKLAEQSSSSVNSITAIVTNIQNETKLAAASLEEGYQEVTNGSTQISSTNEIFSEMKNSIVQMASNIDRVSESLSVINDHSGQVNNKIEDIAAITEESAAGIEETTASSEQTSASMEEITSSTDDLSKLADQLNELVDRFKVNE